MEEKDIKSIKKSLSTLNKNVEALISYQDVTNQLLQVLINGTLVDDPLSWDIVYSFYQPNRVCFSEFRSSKTSTPIVL